LVELVIDGDITIIVMNNMEVKKLECADLNQVILAQEGANDRL
jgi:hypothetical protein